jgi:DNA helicase-2/ATP-dependent DNA helicase PcrA
VADCLEQLGFTSDAHPARAVWRDVRRARLLDASVYDAGDVSFADAALAADAEVLAEVYPAYRDRLSESRAFDRAGLLSATLDALATSPDGDKDLRPAQLFVDDVQNLTPPEIDLVVHLAGRRPAAECSPGDADPEKARPEVTMTVHPNHEVRTPVPTARSATDRLREALPEAVSLSLDAAFRPPPAVCAIAAQIAGSDQAADAVESGPVDPVPLITASSGEQEIRRIAAWIEENVEASRRRDVAVLMRTSDQRRKVVAGLREAGLSAASSAPLREAEVVQDILAYLAVALNPHDDRRLFQIINRPSRGIGRKTKNQIRRAAREAEVSAWTILQEPGDAETLSSRTRSKAREVHRLLQPFVRSVANNRAERSPSDWARDMIEAVGLLTSTTRSRTIDQLEREERVETVLRALDQETSPEGGLRERLGQFLDLAVQGRIGPAPEEDRVRVDTIDGLRGGSFPVVIVPGLEEGRFPDTRSARRMLLLEHERRLLVEAVRHSETTLVLSWAQSRRRRGEDIPTTRSRFLDAIDDDLLAPLDEPPGPADDRRHAYRDSMRVRQSDARPDPKPTEEEANRIRAGHRIRHPKMGMGTVVETEGEGDERTAVVEFDDRGRKNLRLQYVSLTVIGSGEEA